MANRDKNQGEKKMKIAFLLLEHFSTLMRSVLPTIKFFYSEKSRRFEISFHTLRFIDFRKGKSKGPTFPSNMKKDM